MTNNTTHSYSNSLLATIMADESFRPSEPTSLQDTGLPVSLIEALAINSSPAENIV